MQQTNSKGGSAGSLTSSTTSIPTQPPPSFNVVGGSSTNQLNEAVVGFQAEPVRSYVVSSDITSNQAMDRQIQENAST